MAQYTAYNNYMIYFSDQAEYDFAVAVAGSNFINMAPRDAAVLFGIPHPYPSGDMATIPKGIYFFSPLGPGQEIGHPSPSGVFVDDTVDSQLVPGQGGSFFPPGPDLLLVWSGGIIKVNGGAGANPSPITPIPQRRWIGSPEWEPTLEGGTGISVNKLCRDASRTIDGHGYAIRGANLTGVWSRLLNTYRPAFTSRESWERFYVRVRATGGIDIGLWRAHGSVSSSAGAALKLSTTGTIDAYALNAASAETFIASTPPLDLNEWYLIDIIIKYFDGVTPATFRLWLNHVLVINGASDNQNQFHASSDLGKWQGSADTIGEVDLDDWISADVPTNPVSGLEDLSSVDWLMGSHVRKVFTLAASLPGYTGNQGVLNQGNSPESALSNTLTSNVSGSIAEGITDAPTLDIQDTIGTTMGVVAAIVGTRTLNAGATDGELGYKLAGAAAVTTLINQTAAAQNYSVAHLPTGLIVPDEVAPFSVVKVKSADVNLDTTFALVAVLEYIGVWGPEDDPTSLFEIDRLTFLHNCRYANTAWGYVGSVPDAPCYAVGGTYVGNGLYQEIDLPAPCHFLWIRAISGAPTGGVKFYGASIDAHFGTTERTIPNLRVWADAVGDVRFSVSGTSIDINSIGVTYQYIAFCDPGMRYNLCGAYCHGSTGPSPQTNFLIDPEFTPDACFVQSDFLASTSSTAGLYYKGPGNTGSAGNTVGSANVAAFGQFGQGMFVSQSGVHLLSAQMNYSMWRLTQPGCAGVMVQLCSYVGTGINPRTVDLTPISGRFPLFVLVVPVAAAASFFRDPSHAGANSSNTANLTNSTTAITAVAIDQITVQSSLNANGVTYNVFCIPGDTAGMLNGIYFIPNCEPPLGPYIPPTVPDVEIAVMGDGGVVLGESIPITLLINVSGLYTLVPGKTNDTIYNRVTGASTEVVPIPNPSGRTGFISG